MKTESVTTYLEPEETNQSGLLIGRVVALSSNGNPLIAFDPASQTAPVEALTTVQIDESCINKDVAISFAQNRQGTPIVMGVIRSLLDDVIASPVNDSADKPEVIVDGQKLELSAPEEVTIRCGEASITLNKSGKILIKGDHMLNRISGNYKIKSGSIELN